MKKRHFTLTATAVFGIMGIGIAAVIMIFSGIFFAKKHKADDKITKTAPVSLNVTRQTLDLDISACTNETSAALQIEEVLVSTGQQVQEGTALFRVTSDSVQNIRTILQREVLDTNRACELLEAKQKELRLLASQSHDKDLMDGKYAGVVYHSRRDALRKKADDAKEAVDEKQNQVNENLLELTQAQQELAQAQKYLKEAEAAVSENYDNRYNNAYYYTTYIKTKETAQNMVNQLQKQVENLTKKNELLLFEVNEAVCAYHQIVQELEREKLAVQMDYDTKIYDSETASEWYDIQMADLDSEMQEARERYQAALQNIRTFNASIVRNQVCSRYSGVLLDIMVEAGSLVRENDSLVTLYDPETARINVLLSEAEYLAVNQEEAVTISFGDVPERIYEGKVTQVTLDTKVSDQKGSGQIETNYIMTVTIQGDISGISEGMTGSVALMRK